MGENIILVFLSLFHINIVITSADHFVTSKRVLLVLLMTVL